MKKRNVFISCVLVLVLIAVFAVCASASDAEKVDDMSLAANVKSALEADDSLRAFDIGIETRDGVVILSGWVSSQDAVVKAGQVARSVKGARSVESKLTVK
ncbi:MAG: transporter [Syntrophus sp. (in: bacteria)]|nr:transporter [Syntrophus sp. (in: bacteria)]